MLVTYSTIINIKEGDTIFIDKAAVINDGEGADGETEYQIYDIYLEQLPIKFTMLPYEEPTPPGPGPEPTPDINPNISTEYGYTLYDGSNVSLTTGVLKTDGTGLDIHSHISTTVIYNGNTPSAEGNTFYYLGQYAKVDGIEHNSVYNSDGELQAYTIVLYQPEATQINPNSVNSYNYTLYDEYDMMTGSGVAETTGTGYDPSGHVELRSSGVTLTYVNKYAKVDGMTRNAKYDSMGTLQTGKIVLSTYTPPTTHYYLTFYDSMDMELGTGEGKSTGENIAGNVQIDVISSTAMIYPKMGDSIQVLYPLIHDGITRQTIQNPMTGYEGSKVVVSDNPPSPPTPTYDIDPDTVADYSFTLYDNNSGMQIGSGVVQSGGGIDEWGDVKLELICLDGDFDGSQAPLHGATYIGVNEDTVVDGMTQSPAFDYNGDGIGRIALSSSPMVNIDPTMTNQYNFTIYDDTNMVKETGVAQCNGMGYNQFGHVTLTYNEYNGGNFVTINVNKYAKVDGMTHNSIYNESYGTLTTDTVVLSTYTPPQPTQLFTSGTNTATKATDGLWRLYADGSTAYMMNNDLNYWATCDYSNCYVVATVEGNDMTFTYDGVLDEPNDYKQYDFASNHPTYGELLIEMYVQDSSAGQILDDNSTPCPSILFRLNGEHSPKNVISFSNVRVYCTAGQSVSNSVQTELQFTNNSAYTISIRWTAQDGRNSYGWKTSKTIDNMMSMGFVYPGEELLFNDDNSAGINANELQWVLSNATVNGGPSDAIQDLPIEITTYGSPASISISGSSNSD